jgi:hypothetical protein
MIREELAYQIIALLRTYARLAPLGEAIWVPVMISIQHHPGCKGNNSRVKASHILILWHVFEACPILF